MDPESAGRALSEPGQPGHTPQRLLWRPCLPDLGLLSMGPQLPDSSFRPSPPPPAIIYFSSGKLRTTLSLVPRDLVVVTQKQKKKQNKTLCSQGSAVLSLPSSVRGQIPSWVEWREGQGAEGNACDGANSGDVRCFLRTLCVSLRRIQSRARAWSREERYSGCSPPTPKSAAEPAGSKAGAPKNSRRACVRKHVLDFASWSRQPLPPGAPGTLGTPPDADAGIERASRQPTQSSHFKSHNGLAPGRKTNLPVLLECFHGDFLLPFAFQPCCSPYWAWNTSCLQPPQGLCTHQSFSSGNPSPRFPQGWPLHLL